MVISETISNRYRMVWDRQVAPDTLPSNPVADDRTTGVLIGSYWLMISAGLVLALGILFITR
jgi:hypothetical protein